MAREFRRFADGETMARAAAQEVAASAAAAVAARGRFSLVLAGGTTPKRAYEILAGEKMPWAQCHFFFGDERCVPQDDALSNYAMVKAALFDRVPLPAANVHRVPGELPAAAAASACEKDLAAYFGGGKTDFDLVLLGMGEDGHTASLFPGNKAVGESKRWATEVDTDAKPPRWRVSLTLPALCAARDVVFLVGGAGKRDVLAQIRSDPSGAAKRFPSAAVQPAGRLVWFVDDAALGGANL